MVDTPFFEPPPPPRDPQPRPPRPVWAGPPENVLGAAVAVQEVVARTPELVIAVVGVLAYPQGFEFSCLIRHRQGLEHTGLMHGGRHPGRPGGAPEGLPAELFRLGVQFSDGTKITNVGGIGRPHVPGDREPPVAVMVPMVAGAAAAAGSSACGSGPFLRLVRCRSWPSGPQRVWS